MEDTLRVEVSGQKNPLGSCLNPYSNGRYSERAAVATPKAEVVVVLILILMEDTLREQLLPLRRLKSLLS